MLLVITPAWLEILPPKRCNGFVRLSLPGNAQAESAYIATGNTDNVISILSAWGVSTTSIYVYAGQAVYARSVVAATDLSVLPIEEDN